MDSPTTSQSRLVTALKDEVGQYAVGIAALVLTNLCVAGIPYTTKLIFDALEAADAGADPEALPRVASLAGLMVGLAVLMGGFRVVSRVFIFNGGRRVEYRLRNQIYAHLQTLGPSFFGRMPIGDLVSRITNDITAVRLLGGPGILNLANTALVYASAVTPMMILSPSLTMWALAPLVGVFAGTRAVGPRIYERSYRAQQDLSRVTALANESITGIGVVHAYHREEQRQALFAEASAEYRESYLGFILFRSVLMPILAGMGGLGTLTILYFGGQAVIAGTLSLGDFVAFLGYLAMLMWPTVALGWMVAMWQRGRSAMDRLGEILDAEPDVVSGSAEIGDLHGAIEFRGLSFAYPNAADEEVLHDVSLRIEPGEQVLIVGPSGSGKSTLVSLLPRLADVAPGSVLIDGADIRDLPLATLRRRIAFVPQETFLFSLTVAENVAFGVDGPSLEAVQRAAALASMTGDIARFPDGFETLVGERGVTLSGGQRQRMTIARAAMLEPAVWVFDDCLSSVDAGTEQRILRNLRTMTTRATALFVSHRLLGFEDVDRVVVLQDGRITEQGTHQELVSAGGWYERLYRRQKLDDELTGQPLEETA